MTQFKPDAIYAHPLEAVGAFQFDETVVRVFPDMIARSVPGYDLVVPSIALMAERYAQPHSTIYDLGCSLGAVTLAIRRRPQRPSVRLIAVDNSPAMIAQCRQLLAADEQTMPCELIEADIQEIAITQASVVVLNFTLQFLAPTQRETLIQTIYEGLLPEGVLILSEKVVFEDPSQNERFIELHHAFKRANGYSDLEIAQKRTALENVLIPETIARHRQRALQAGFRTFEMWFQAFNFASFLAIK